MPPNTNLFHWLANEYHDLNGSCVEILEAPPTPLEFSRMIHISRPVVIKGLQVAALKKWTDDYLINKMGGRKMSVATTPNGLADAITQGPDGRDYFVEPYVGQITMSELLSRLGTDSSRSDPSEICYLQSQNGNLYASKFFKGVDDPSELESLREDVPSEISWCSEALDRHPDAVNLWIGDGKSSTSVHNDPYENIYTVIRGAKFFTLLPPTEGQYLVEKRYPHARYTRAPDARLQLEISPDVPSVRWSSISDPHFPNAQRHIQFM
ncbi:hypothetical protein APHAL10511_001856 [Amanita phalloides]|nr:hypothetical protein APHAL10511_001856 [Amanita phalloides]